jgi:O-acetyl-ADP-ribose deacetylase (regulator of RNase III)
MGKIINVDSVSIPAISSGVLGFPKEKCAETIIKRVAQWFALQLKIAEDMAKKQNIDTQTALSRVTKLTKVRLCNFDNQTVQVFAKELNKIS